MFSEEIGADALKAFYFWGIELDLQIYHWHISRWWIFLFSTEWQAIKWW
jgi:hypothetical protein